ncbi:MAG: helix-turn-helix transcriptional regulator [Clostridiales bacterium]|nr:helix-turn-helix transcriptional regulator [Clostridiales bacterium]
MLVISDVIRGYTDTIILAQLREGDSYGYELNKRIQSITDSEFELKEATLYTAFRRLEDDAYIISYWGDENVGARRRYYTITEKGLELYRENLQDWDKIKDMIDSLLKDVCCKGWLSRPLLLQR